MENKYKIRIRVFSVVAIIMLCIATTVKEFQNDTFYIIKLGGDILKNGVDLVDHYCWVVDLVYTYPHWLYDVFIYLMYTIGGFTAIHISTCVLFLILLGLVFKTNIKLTDNISVSALATFICALAVSGFATARAQLASFLVFILEIYFIEMFLKNGKKKYLFGLLILSLILCNIHVAVWPFYFILYLPYIAEYIVSLIVSKIKIKKDNKFTLM